MKRVSENPMNGTVTYELSPGHWVARPPEGVTLDVMADGLPTFGETHYAGAVTREWIEPRYIVLDEWLVREQGLEAIAQSLGAKLPTGRVNVMQDGRIVGTVPAAFDPLFIKSKSVLYDPRPGDFVRDGDVWVASRTLGSGDMEAIVGFERSRADEEQNMGTP